MLLLDSLVYDFHEPEYSTSPHCALTQGPPSSFLTIPFPISWLVSSPTSNSTIHSFGKFRALKPSMSFSYFVSRRLSYVAHSRPFYPAVAEYGPKRLDNLIPGKIYLWCTCGLSKSQPWCDGSHKPTHFRPIQWVVPATKPDSVQTSSHSICQCKYTSTPPLCDGTHNQLHQEIADRQAHCSCSHSGSAPQYILPDGQRTFCDHCGNVRPNVPS
ncbi:hypothetical protein CRM22_004352 [Opisthorchis felineus]|uniref:Iron-binding zinc finger CDGSH type domain-containing protein n=1 Tax=Opisthorchis felineus TaxID=147828 RepID=A0A4S2M1V0_OPIFE|nr:hypothetical protein CRM22_004352 [Opisthorchis felineus]